MKKTKQPKRTLTIKGEEFKIPEKVGELIQILSTDRKTFLKYLEHTHQLLGPNYDKYEEIEKTLAPQRKK